jgi:hypothetical protein
MSYATMQDVLFALDLDRLRVAESAEATPRRARGPNPNYQRSGASRAT